MPHDIIDNRNEKLVEHINLLLDSTEKARFAVGYFFLSGFQSIFEELQNVKELRLLIGNTTNLETLEQLAEGHRRLEQVVEIAEAQLYVKRADARQMGVDTAENISQSVEFMDQSDEAEALIKSLVQMIAEKRLLVRVYTKGRLHAKAYIFDYRQDGRYEKGAAIIGSSNLTLSGLSHNTELNVVVQGAANHSALCRWFDELWGEAEDFDESLMEAMKASWGFALVKPYDIYMKTLYELVKDRLEGGDDREILWEDDITRQLADFQKVAVRQAVQIIRDNGGVFVSDVVGLGKSYVGAAIIKHFEWTEHARPLIICPAPLVNMWERYNEVYRLNARVLSMGRLRENVSEDLEDIGEVTSSIFDDVKYRDRDFVLVDESHNFRHSDTQRYKVLQSFLATGRRCCFLTATPRNKSAWDVFHQIKLFHPSDITDLPIDPPDLREYFRKIEKGERRLPDLLGNILIRRTRNHILRWYGFDAQTDTPVNPSRFQQYLNGSRKAYVLVGGKKQFFPKRSLETVSYSIEDTYQGLYHELRGYLGKPRGKDSALLADGQLTYARYGLWNYVIESKQKQEPYVNLQRSGANLRGLMRILLFKRFESSVYAFRQTISRLLNLHRRFAEALESGIVPAGDEAQAILYEASAAEEQELMDALKAASGRYKIADFNVDLLQEHLSNDIALLQKTLSLVEPITPDQDAKLQSLLDRLGQPPLQGGKCLIFTQYADTADYLYKNLNPDNQRDDIDVIFSGDKSKERAVGRFAPKANPEYQFQRGESELSTLIATDVLAEGLNLQDGNKIVNYDLHWNPVRLIQRFGRIDRIGSEHDVIYGFNFLPETGIERNLGLRERLRFRIQEIHESIGEDAAILDESEQLNETAMYAIYEGQGDQLSLFDDDKELMNLNEAEEFLRQLQRDDPGEFERIAKLRDGIRAAVPRDSKGTYLFCQAGRYQQLFLLNETGEIISRDIPRILTTIKCEPDLLGGRLPADYNETVMRVKQLFAQEVRARQAERRHKLSLSRAQHYVLRELQLLFAEASDEDLQAQINLLERAFRGSITDALNRELNLLRRNGVTSNALLRNLSQLYRQHNMKEWNSRQQIAEYQNEDLPKIVCSAALV
jgi:superfamily II DNA or RNA helicase